MDVTGDRTVPEAIRALIDRYCDAVTRADWAQLESVFAPDGVIEIGPPFGIKVEGSGAIRNYFEVAAAGVEYLLQTAHSSVIDVIDVRHARSRSTIHEMSLAKTTVESDLGPPGTEVNFEQYGLYWDRLVKVDEACRSNTATSSRCIWCRMPSPARSSHPELNSVAISGSSVRTISATRANVEKRSPCSHFTSHWLLLLRIDLRTN